MDIDGDTREEDGFKVIVVSGLTKNVHRGHLVEIFEVYGKVVGLDLPLFKVCKCSPYLVADR
jgi:RNA-binding protein with serine-rich domain 1